MQLISSLGYRSFSIDTACSSTLVALESAVQALRIGKCNMALCSGVNLQLEPTTWIGFCKMGFSEGPYYGQSGPK